MPFGGRHFVRTSLSLSLGEHAVLDDGRRFGLVRVAAHHTPQQTVTKGDVAKLGQTDAGLAAAISRDTYAKRQRKLLRPKMNCGVGLVNCFL